MESEITKRKTACFSNDCRNYANYDRHLSIDMDNHIIIETDDAITFEEYQEIINLAKQVLRRNNKKREVRILSGFSYL